MTWIAVVLGGAFGAVARHGVNVAAARLMTMPTPWATATVNMVGSLVIGLVAGAVAAERLSISPTTRAFVVVGILGGFTTFSSFMLDSLTLLQTGAPMRAAFNLIGQLIVGLALTIGGYYIGLRV
jgi:CrcB protein